VAIDVHNNTHDNQDLLTLHPHRNLAIFLSALAVW
jgi:hypothetical protein